MLDLRLLPILLPYGVRQIHRVHFGLGCRRYSIFEVVLSARLIPSRNLLLSLLLLQGQLVLAHLLNKFSKLVLQLKLLPRLIDKAEVLQALDLYRFLVGSGCWSHASQ